jgi:hypothetical protein
MLNYGIFLLSLQSWCYGHVHGMKFLCRVNVESRSLSRTTFSLLEGQDLSSSEGDGIHSVSQASLGEMNGDMNFASSNGLRLGKCLVIGCSGQGIGVAEVVVPKFLSRPPWKGFF